MTMLDSMRRHKVWLQWSLVLVVLAFIIAYIPTFVSGNGSASSGDAIAKVEGHEITSDEFRRTYQAQLQAYRSAYGGQMSDQHLKQLGIEQQIQAGGKGRFEIHGSQMCAGCKWKRPP